MGSWPRDARRVGSPVDAVNNDEDEVVDRDVADRARERLARHLANWLGARPASGDVVVHSPYRDRPGGDGEIRPIVGAATPHATVVSVAKRYLAPMQAALSSGGLDGLAEDLAKITGQPGATLDRGVFRYCQRLVEYRELGRWWPADSPGVPAWLAPFNGDVLVATVDGVYAAGVGRKRHDGFAQELAVVTAEEFRRQGFARNLVAPAARRVYEEGSIVTYLHRIDDTASAAVAESPGFPDTGWSILSLDRGSA